ncbi:MAG: aspartate kinase [Candidatus Taylorbacteria bacterium]|nr:aspartate kinase [Candidatus Taylorbacteria bacterium]
MNTDNQTAVAKFGGSSIATPERLQLVGNIVHTDPRIKYVVVSAPGKAQQGDNKVTDLLLLAHQEVSTGVPFTNTFAIIAQKFKALALEARVAIEVELEAIRYGIASAKPRDWVASRGEYLSAKITAAFLGFTFIDATECICFTAGGKFDKEATRQKLQSVAKQGPAVIPGFYGALPDGTIKTFPRGGSDITGAIVAAGVGADIYLNYTDVPGFLTADPKVVSGTRQIPRLTFREVRELSYAGANVLQAETVFPVREAGIPILILSTFEPKKGGTLICPDQSLNENPHDITGIAGRENFTRVTLERAGMNEEHGFAERALAVFAHNAISVEHMPSSVDSLSIVVAHSELNGRLETVRQGLQTDCAPDNIQIAQNEMALIAVVGKSVLGEETLAVIVSSLRQAHIPIRMINLGSSKLSVIIGVENASFKNAMQTLHQALCTK